jgi:hypothetical protein
MNQQATIEELLEEVSKGSTGPEGKNDCAGEDNQQFKRQTDSSDHELLVSSGSLWLAERNLYC